MIKTGLASVTFRKKSTAEIITFVKKAGLSAIEWAGDAHVPPGDIRLAKEVRDMTVSQGLEVSSYGSYYCIGSGNDIRPYLETASTLGGKTMRIWAGNRPSASLSSEERKALVCEAKRISEVADEYKMTLSIECHNSSLTDCLESQLAFLNEVDKSNFLTYWQALLEVPRDKQMHTLKAVYDTQKLTNIHVYFHDENRNRITLREGEEYWRERLSFLNASGVDRYALIEFVKDDTEENFLDDAKVLTNLIESHEEKTQ